MEIKNTKDVSKDGIKMAVYGKSGIGKTTLMSTAPNPIIISCESGLLSLADTDVDYIEIDNYEDIDEAFDFVVDSDYETICIDSISEIAEVMLSHFKEDTRDPRQAYGRMNDEMTKMIRKFRDIKGKHVVFSAKMKKGKDEDGVILYNVSMPGNSLMQDVPFFFDEVLFMTVMENDDGDEFRVLKTQATYSYEAKDRSGSLNEIEEPNLKKIFAKIAGETSSKKASKNKKKPKKKNPDAEGDWE